MSFLLKCGVRQVDYLTPAVALLEGGIFKHEWHGWGYLEWMAMLTGSGLILVGVYITSTPSALPSVEIEAKSLLKDVEVGVTSASDIGPEEGVHRKAGTE